MTQKDYIKIAAILKRDRSLAVAAVLAICDNTVSELSMMFAADNDRFDSAKFDLAAGFGTDGAPK